MLRSNSRYNNGRLAADPKLACQNFLNALERIPKVIETHERELAKTKEQIPVFEAAASGVWRKEDELRTLKRNAAELDRKIALSLAPPTPEKEEQAESKKQVSAQLSVPAPLQLQHKATSPSSASPQEDREVTNHLVVAKPKWR